MALNVYYFLNWYHGCHSPMIIIGCSVINRRKITVKLIESNASFLVKWTVKLRKLKCKTCSFTDKCNLFYQSNLLASYLPLNLRVILPQIIKVYYRKIVKSIYNCSQLNLIPCIKHQCPIGLQKMWTGN